MLNKDEKWALLKFLAPVAVAYLVTGAMVIGVGLWFGVW